MGVRYKANCEDDDATGSQPYSRPGVTSRARYRVSRPQPQPKSSTRASASGRAEVSPVGGRMWRADLERRTIGENDAHDDTMSDRDALGLADGDRSDGAVIEAVDDIPLVQGCDGLRA